MRQCQRAPQILSERPGNQKIAQNVPGSFRGFVAVEGRFARCNFTPSRQSVSVNPYQDDAARGGAPKAGLKKMHQRHLYLAKLDAVNFHGHPSQPAERAFSFSPLRQP